MAKICSDFHCGLLQGVQSGLERSDHECSPGGMTGTSFGYPTGEGTAGRRLRQQHQKKLTVSASLTITASDCPLA